MQSGRASFRPRGLTTEDAFLENPGGSQEHSCRHPAHNAPARRSLASEAEVQADLADPAIILEAIAHTSTAAASGELVIIKIVVDGLGLERDRVRDGTLSAATHNKANFGVVASVRCARGAKTRHCETDPDAVVHVGIAQATRDIDHGLLEEGQEAREGDAEATLDRAEVPHVGAEAGGCCCQTGGALDRACAADVGCGDVGLKASHEAAQPHQGADPGAAPAPAGTDAD